MKEMMVQELGEPMTTQENEEAALKTTTSIRDNTIGQMLNCGQSPEGETKAEQAKPPFWHLYIDRASNTQGGGASIILISIKCSGFFLGLFLNIKRYLISFMVGRVCSTIAQITYNPEIVLQPFKFKW